MRIVCDINCCPLTKVICCYDDNLFSAYEPQNFSHLNNDNIMNRQPFLHLHQ